MADPNPAHKLLARANGQPLPQVGLGTWKIDPLATPTLVTEAIRAGYRHLDCACDYGNEREVGIGIRAALDEGICAREDLWITSKLWNTFHGAEHVSGALDRSLNDLGLEQLDAYLIHFPIALRYVSTEKRYPPGWTFDPEAETPRMEFAQVPLQETWSAMEKMVRADLVRHIGICNVGTAQLRDLLACADIAPAMLQVEMHPYLTQQKLLRFCQEEGIAVTAFSPFGASSYLALGMAGEEESVLAEPLVGAIAQRHGTTPAQIVLRWGVQRGTAVIPKTSQTARLTENLSLFDFELSLEEMVEIEALNRNRRFNDPGQFGEAAFNTFCPIYE